MGSSGFLIVLLAVVVAGGVGWWLYRRAPAHPSSPPSCPASSGLAPGCNYYREVAPDPTLTKEPPPPYLIDFGRSVEGNPWCVPTWYALRYVRAATGGYGPLSPWTTAPVQAGTTATAGACPPGGCWFQSAQSAPRAGGVPPGPATCSFNTPTIGVVQPLAHAPQDGVWVNVHRQSGALDPTQEGDIVGFLLPSAYSHPGGAWTAAAAMQDVLYSEVQSQGECKGC